MPNYNFLKNILAEIDSYKTEKGGYPETLREFAYWHYNRMFPSTEEAIDLKKYEEDHVNSFGGNIRNTISYMFTAIHRFKLHYLKTALGNNPLESYEEVAFLFSLVYGGPMTHSQLIDMHVQNKPTGTEIIKRLIKKKFIEQAPSPKDKRSKVLTVTTLGMNQFSESIGKVSQLSEMLLYPLSQKETIAFFETTAKLYNAHRQIYSKEKKMEFEKIVEKYSPNENGENLSTGIAENG